MKSEIRRAVIALVVFAVVFLLSGFIIGWTGYDVYVKSIEFLSAVIAAGCYWIGSRPADGK